MYERVKQPYPFQREIGPNTFIGRIYVDIPLVRFEGFLKQIEWDGQEDAAKICLEMAFPGFWSQDQESEHHKKNYQRSVLRGKTNVFFRPIPNDYDWL